MKRLILESNRNLIHQIDSVSKELNTIIKPLFQKLPFSYFGYSKIFKSGHYLCLPSNPEFFQSWLDYSIENEFLSGNNKKCFLSNDTEKLLQQLKTTPQNSFYKYLWPINKEKMPGLSLCNKFNMYYGINLMHNTADYLEDFVFAAPIEWEQVIGVYLNDFHIIEKFITYFKNKAHYLINPIDKKHLAFSPFFRKEFHGAMDNLDVDRNFILNRKKFFEETQLSQTSFMSNMKLCLTKLRV